MLNNFYHNLSSSRKLSFEIGIFILVAVVLTFGILLPRRKKFLRAGQDLKIIKQEISRIEGLLEGRDIKKGLSDFQKKIQVFDRRFPTKEEKGVKIIADLARQVKMEIRSLRPAAKAGFTDEKGRPVKIEGKTCYGVAVLLSGEGRFENLVEYLRRLDTSAELFTTVDKIDLNRVTVDGELSIQMRVTYYLLI